MRGVFGILLIGGGVVLMYGLFTGKITLPGVNTYGTDFGGNASADWLPKGTAPTPTHCHPGYVRDTFGICQPAAVNGVCHPGLFPDPTKKFCLPPQGQF